MQPDSGEGMSTDSIMLFGKDHGIESEQFTLVFRSPLDAADEGRFEEKRADIEEQFRAVDEPNVFQVVMGTEKQPPKPVIKILNDFGRNGKPEWSAQFGENAVSVSSMQYTKWEEVWPSVRERLNLLLSCVDPFKFVASIDYKVTDTLIEKIGPGTEMKLLSRNILRAGDWVPGSLLSYGDPRWDFSAGVFQEASKASEILERVEARSFLNGDNIVTSISNIFSLRLKYPVRLKEYFQGDSIDGHVTGVFEDFHDRNKVTIRSILTEALLSRMGL